MRLIFALYYSSIFHTKAAKSPPITGATHQYQHKSADKLSSIFLEALNFAYAQTSMHPQTAKTSSQNRFSNL